MSTPKGNKTPKWKGSLSRLFSCGSGKKGEEIDLNFNAPLARSPNGTLEDGGGEVNYEVITTKATPGHGDETEVEISYTEVKEIGKGTFGVVYRAKLNDTGEHVAIKKVLHDERYKNRELQMMRKLDHPYILNLLYFFYSRGERYKSNEVYLNMMLDYMPETLYSVTLCDGTRSKPLLDIAYVRVYMYQVFRSLAYLHAVGIAHRDVKPQNLLLNPDTHVIKLCDFGSAKELVKGEANIAYICSRYYRAPELVLGTTNYTSQIDVWSAGCVLAEILLGQPIFPGANGPDQLVEIIKVLGTPSVEDLYEINPNYTDMRFPHLLPHPWGKVLKEATDMDVLDLVSHVLVYAPSKRYHPIEAVSHQFFEPLRRGMTRLPDGKPMPSTLFNFTREELAINPDLNSRLAPAEGVTTMDYHYEPQEFNAQNSSKLESKPHTMLGQIGGSFRSSFKGIKKVATSSGKKKKKKKSTSGGIEDEEGQHDVPATLNFSGGDEEGDLERAEEAGGRVEAADIHLRPSSEDLELSSISHGSGRHEGTIPHKYREFLGRREEEEVDGITEQMSELGGGGGEGSVKKKKKKKKVAEPLADEDIERAIEEMIIPHEDVAQMNSTPSSAKKKKKKKLAASTPAEDEARSFEESPDFAAQMTYGDSVRRSFREEPPLASDITYPADEGSGKKKKKKSTKKSEPPPVPDEDFDEPPPPPRPRKKKSIDTEF